MTRSPDPSVEPRGIVAEIVGQLESARGIYGPAFDQVTTHGKLEDETREAVIATIAAVATCLRKLAPAFGSLQALPETERPELELILLRLMTDSLSITLADAPDSALLVSPDEVEDLLDHQLEGRA